MNKAGYLLKKAAPVIFTGLSVAGTVGTSILAVMDTRKYDRLVEEEKPETTLQYAWVGIRAYWRTGLCAVATIGSSIASESFNRRALAGMTGLIALASEKDGKIFDAIKEKYGEEAAKDIYKEANKAPERNEDAPIEYPEDYDTNITLFYDTVSEEWFTSSYQRVHDGLGYLTKILVRTGSATENDYRWLVGAGDRKDPTHDADKFGWSKEYFMDEYGMMPWIDSTCKTFRLKDGTKYQQISFVIPPTEEALERVQ